MSALGEQLQRAYDLACCSPGFDAAAFDAADAELAALRAQSDALRALVEAHAVFDACDDAASQETFEAALAEARALLGGGT